PSNNNSTKSLDMICLSAMKVVRYCQVVSALFTDVFPFSKRSSTEFPGTCAGNQYLDSVDLKTQSLSKYSRYNCAELLVQRCKRVNKRRIFLIAWNRCSKLIILIGCEQR